MASSHNIFQLGSFFAVSMSTSVQIINTAHARAASNAKIAKPAIAPIIIESNAMLVVTAASIKSYG